MMHGRDGYTDARGRWTAKPILLPDARKMSDVFSEARFGQGAPAVDLQDKTCWRYVSGTSSDGAAPHVHFGGRDYIKTRKDGRFWCFGLAGKPIFTSCIARPLAGVVEKAEESLIGHAGSFEVIKRSDGILVTLRDNHGIGSRWIALLDQGETLLSLMSDEDRKRYEDRKAQQALMRSLVDGENVDTARAKELGIEIRVDKY